MSAWDVVYDDRPTRHILVGVFWRLQSSAAAVCVEQRDTHLRLWLDWRAFEVGIYGLIRVQIAGLEIVSFVRQNTETKAAHLEIGYCLLAG